jgi:hypothetical protein
MRPLLDRLEQRIADFGRVICHSALDPYSTISSQALAQPSAFGPNFSNYVVTYGNALEFIADTLYDTQTYAAAGQTSLSYFQTASTPQTIANTNMPLAGQLPDRQGFLIMSIRCYPITQPASSARAASGTTPQPGAIKDFMTMIAGGVVTFNFLNKNYGSFPLWLLPAGGGAFPFFALEGATADPGGFVDFANNGIPDARDIYVLEQPLFLPPQTKIGVTANWNAIATINVNTPIKILFDGLMVRPVQ